LPDQSLERECVKDMENEMGRRAEWTQKLDKKKQNARKVI
jgi:hypothetical protein